MGQQTPLRMPSEIVAKPGVKEKSEAPIQNTNQRSTLMESISGNIAESSATHHGNQRLLLILGWRNFSYQTFLQNHVGVVP